MSPHLVFPPYIKLNDDVTETGALLRSEWKVQPTSSTLARRSFLHCFRLLSLFLFLLFLAVVLLISWSRCSLCIKHILASVLWFEVNASWHILRMKCHWFLAQKYSSLQLFWVYAKFLNLSQGRRSTVWWGYSLKSRVWYWQPTGGAGTLSNIGVKDR